MFECDDFLDILGEISDDVISDIAVPVRKKENRRVLKIFTLFAAVFIFVICGIIINNNFSDTYYIIPSEEPLLSDSSDIITEYFTENTTEIITENPSAESENTTQYEKETAFTENTDVFFTENVHSTEVTEADSRNTEPSAENDLSGETSGIKNEIIFNEADKSELIYVGIGFSYGDYPVTEKTDIYTLEKIYGTKILPSYLPAAGNSSILSNAGDEKYTVYYNKDKSRVYCNNNFSFVLKNGSVLNIHSSNNEIPKLSAENKDAKISYINDIPVLMFRCTGNGLVTLYSAYLCKDSCYFRIQMSGIAASQDEFIKIITSFTERPEP